MLPMSCKNLTTLAAISRSKEYLPLSGRKEFVADGNNLMAKEIA